MDVFLRGQDIKWAAELKKICEKDGIFICVTEAEAKDVRLLITDFPIGWVKRGAYAKLPFLVASRDGREEQILKAFAAGAEDYLALPVAPKVARARILRILKPGKTAVRQTDDWQAGVHFTPNEQRLLLFLTKHPGKVFTRDELLLGAFGAQYEGYDRNVDNYMKQLRKKLPEQGGRIETVYGVGYRYMVV